MLLFNIQYENDEIVYLQNKRINNETTKTKHATKLELKLTELKARFHYERGKEHSLFVLLIFFALASILTARFNRRSIKERKNALFYARSGNEP